jgi:hypothetical protein
VGGYIDDQNNTYNKETLVGKDGFNEFNTDNYLKFNIEIRDTVKELSAIFANLTNKVQRKGVIKIDIEGYEPVVLLGIAQSLPAEMECYVVFESFNENLDIDKVLRSFDGRATAYKITEKKPWKQRWHKWIKLLYMLFNDTISWQLEENISGNWKGDIVLHIRAN